MKARKWEMVGYLLQKGADVPTTAALAFIQSQDPKDFKAMMKGLSKEAVKELKDKIKEYYQDRALSEIPPLNKAIIAGSNFEEFRKLSDSLDEEAIDFVETADVSRAIKNCTFCSPYTLCTMLGRSRMARHLRSRNPKTANEKWSPLLLDVGRFNRNSAVNGSGRGEVILYCYDFMRVYVS